MTGLSVKLAGFILNGDWCRFMFLSGDRLTGVLPILVKKLASLYSISAFSWYILLSTSFYFSV